jgi:hypothetical protein
LKVTIVRKHVAKVKCTGPLQLFTMYACLFMDGQVRCHGADVFKRAGVIRSVRKYRLVLTNSFGHEAHPVNICQAAVDSDSD